MKAWLSLGLLVVPYQGMAEPPATDAGSLIAESVVAHGLERSQPLEIRFTFRDVPYHLSLRGSEVHYERTVPTDKGPRVDHLHGDQLTVTLNGAPVELSKRRADRLRRSLNSVAYFALLPRPLQDGAVIATGLGQTRLEGQSWDTLEVRFQEVGGGDDHDDVFRYWLHPTTHRIGYLAYVFHTGEGGVRLRKVLQHHEINGVVLADYANLGRDGQGHTIDDAVRDFEAGTLPTVSTIELTELTVTKQ